jgi:hypothetical protein
MITPKIVKEKIITCVECCEKSVREKIYNDLIESGFAARCAEGLCHSVSILHPKARLSLATL